MMKAVCLVCATMSVLLVSRHATTGDEVTATNSPPSTRSEWTRSTGQDDYRRVLTIRTNRFGGEYAVNQPIPVAVEIRNLGPEEPDGPHPAAQLFPHLDVWVRQGEGVQHEMLELDIRNRLRIPKDDEFEHLFDLRNVVDLSRPGVYEVAVGHWNYLISDGGDWTGMLRSPFRRIEVVAGE